MPKSRGRTVVRAAAVIAACLGATLALTGCEMPTGSAAASADDSRPLVLTTFTVLADMAANVAGDDLRVESITKVGAEIHGYEPTPLDIAKASEADLILDNGLGLEAWFAQFVQSVDAPHVVVSDGVEPIAIAGDAYDGLPNPHAWMSPHVAQGYVGAMVEAFAALDPDNAAAYARRGSAYQEELRAVADELEADLAAVPAAQRVLVTCEGAFSYLARDAGLEEVYLWPVNAEQQATPQQIAAAIEEVDSREVPAVFCESTVSDKAMMQVADATGATLAGTLYVDSLSEADGPVPTYLDLLRHDAELIAAGLTGDAS
ncbi:metal ABC transporter substrate-binding protein [Demequina sp. NBRC 110055]|uniref:metal ABC transporter substrate-binding protein n=1 Tax=Demequina sp. NBRC 110055 TaxID=1570344 RepID=UPI0009FFC1FA|nr:metal ABC transporter substrate-binding protein [Demequina sp. NBRC 110055]